MLNLIKRSVLPTGFPDSVPKEYAKFAIEWVEMGATIIGGCCEVGPRHIEQLAKDLSENGHKIV